MKDMKLGTYLLSREPEIEERIMVINTDNVFFQQWGTILNKDHRFGTFKVKLDSFETPHWFCRFEIGWDSGH